MPDTTPQYLTAPQLATKLGLCVKTIRRAIKGGLPHHRLTPGGQYLFVRAEVEEHMQRNSEKADAPAMRRKRRLRVPAEVTERLRADGYDV